MKTILFSIGLLLVNVITVNAQCFIRTFGGTPFDATTSIVQSKDGGFVIGGHTESFGAGLNDFWLIKTDASGNRLWARTFGDTSQDRAPSIISTSDDGFLLMGMTQSFGARGYDAFVVKTDLNGDLQWAQRYGGANSEFIVSAAQRSNGDFILAGRTSSFGQGMDDFMLMRIDSSGNLVWAKTYGSATVDYLYVRGSMKLTNDGGIAMVGWTSGWGAGGEDIWLVKTDSSGTVQWTRTYGGTNSDRGHAVIQTADGGFAVCGETKSFGAGNYDAYLLKTDALGNPQWIRTVGDTAKDRTYSLLQTNDGGYMMCGWYTRPTIDAMLVKFDSSGNLQWIRGFGGNGNDQFCTLIPTTAGDYAISGYTYSFGSGDRDGWLIRTDAQGDIPGCLTNVTLSVSKPVPTVTSPAVSGIPAAITQTKVTATQTNPAPPYTTPCKGPSIISNTLEENFLLQNYPNPFSSTTTISFSLPHREYVMLTVFDVLGREVATLVNGVLDSGDHSIEFVASNLTNGFYVSKLTAGKNIQQKVMILMK